MYPHLQQCFDSNDLRVKRSVMDILGAACLLDQGHKKVLDGV